MFARMRTRLLIPTLSAIALTAAAVISMARGAEMLSGESLLAKAAVRTASTGAVCLAGESYVSLAGLILEAVHSRKAFFAATDLALV